MTIFRLSNLHYSRYRSRYVLIWSPFLLSIIFAICGTLICAGQLIRTDKQDTTFLNNGLANVQLNFELRVNTADAVVSYISFHPSESNLVQSYNISVQQNTTGFYYFTIFVKFEFPGELHFSVSTETRDPRLLGIKVLHKYEDILSVYGIGMKNEQQDRSRLLLDGGYKLLLEKFFVPDEKSFTLRFVSHPKILLSLSPTASIRISSEEKIIRNDDVRIETTSVVHLRPRSYRTGSARLEFTFPPLSLINVSFTLSLNILIPSTPSPPPIVLQEENIFLFKNEHKKQGELNLKAYNIPKDVLDVFIISSGITFSLDKKSSLLNTDPQLISLISKEVNLTNKFKMNNILNTSSVYVRTASGLSIRAIIYEEELLNESSAESETEDILECSTEDAEKKCTDNQNDREEISATAQSNQKDEDGEGHTLALIIIPVLVSITLVVISAGIYNWYKSRSVYYPWPGHLDEANREDDSRPIRSNQRSSIGISP